jgi:hypothetical protein
MLTLILSLHCLTNETSGTRCTQGLQLNNNWDTKAVFVEAASAQSPRLPKDHTDILCCFLILSGVVTVPIPGFQFSNLQEADMICMMFHDHFEVEVEATTHKTTPPG